MIHERVSRFREEPTVDPMKMSLEELLYLRLGHFFEQLKESNVPELYRVLLDQFDRAVFRQAIERNDHQLNAAASYLGIDRNTLARKARKLKLPSAGKAVKGRNSSRK